MPRSNGTSSTSSAQAPTSSSAGAAKPKRASVVPFTSTRMRPTAPPSQTPSQGPSQATGAHSATPAAGMFRGVSYCRLSVNCIEQAYYVCNVCLHGKATDLAVLSGLAVESSTHMYTKRPPVCSTGLIGEVMFEASYFCPLLTLA